MKIAKHLRQIPRRVCEPQAPVNPVSLALCTKGTVAAATGAGFNTWRAIGTSNDRFEKARGDVQKAIVSVLPCGAEHSVLVDGLGVCRGAGYAGTEESVVARTKWTPVPEALVGGASWAICSTRTPRDDRRSATCRSRARAGSATFRAVGASHGNGGSSRC